MQSLMQAVQLTLLLEVPGEEREGFRPQWSEWVPRQILWVTESVGIMQVSRW